MNTKLKWLILVSLLANVLLVGVLLGDFSHRLDRHFGPQGGPPAIERDAQLNQLPEAIRADVKNMMAKARRDNAPLVLEIDRARDEAQRILSDERFDEAAYQSVMDQIHSLHGQLKQHMVEDVKEMAKGLTQDQRTALANVLRRPPMRDRDGPKPDMKAGDMPPPAPPAPPPAAE